MAVNIQKKTSLIPVDTNTAETDVDIVERERF